MPACARRVMLSSCALPLSSGKKSRVAAGTAHVVASSIRAMNDAICPRFTVPPGLYVPGPLPLATPHHTTQSMFALCTLLDGTSEKLAGGTEPLGHELSVARATARTGGVPPICSALPVRYTGLMCIRRWPCDAHSGAPVSGSVPSQPGSVG